MKFWVNKLSLLHCQNSAISKHNSCNNLDKFILIHKNHNILQINYWLIISAWKQYLILNSVTIIILAMIAKLVQPQVVAILVLL